MQQISRFAENVKSLNDNSELASRIFPASDNSGPSVQVFSATTDSTHGAGHNSQAADIERTADAIRKNWIRKDTSLTQKWVVELLCSRLSAHAKLYGIVSKMYANEDGTSIFPSIATMQFLTGLSRPTAIKAKAELVNSGFLEFERKSKGRLSDILKLAFPDAANGQAPLPLGQRSSSFTVERSTPFTVKAVYENATVKNEGSNGKGALPDLVLPCVVEEEQIHTPRASGCSEDVSQPSKEGFPSAEQLQTWYETTKRWGCQPGVKNPNHIHRWKTDADLKGAVITLGKGFSQETVEQALFVTLADMEARSLDPLTPASKMGTGPCLAYFNKEFPGKLSEIRNREHNDRVNAKAVEAKAENEVNGAKAANEAANEKKLGALDHRLAIGNQAAQKRIESGVTPSKLNGQGAIASAVTGAPGRFQNDWKVPGMALVGLTGKHLNRIFEEAPGATLDDIERAAETEKPQTSAREMRSIEDILSSICHKVRRTISIRTDKALKALGAPETFCGGTPHPQFKSEWICLSTAKVAEIVAKGPDITRAECSADALEHLSDWFDLMCPKDHSDFGNGMQERIENELEQRILARQAKAVKDRQKTEREAEERRIAQEREAEQKRQWEAERPKREAEEKAKQEADAANLAWTGEALELTESGRHHLAGIDRVLVRELVNAASRQFEQFDVANAPTWRRAKIWRGITKRLCEWGCSEPDGAAA